MEEMKIKHLYHKLRNATEEQKEEVCLMVEEILDEVCRRFPQYYSKYARKFAMIFDRETPFRNYGGREMEYGMHGGGFGMRGQIGFYQDGSGRGNAGMYSEEMRRGRDSRGRFTSYNPGYNYGGGYNRSYRGTYGGGYNHSGREMGGGEDYQQGYAEPMGGLDEEEAREYVSRLQNADGTRGAHWDVPSIKRIMEESPKLKQHSLWDVYAAMNMIYSDYYMPSKDTHFYVKLTEKFLDDKDAPQDKMARYMRAMEG